MAKKKTNKGKSALEVNISQGLLFGKMLCKKTMIIFWPLLFVYIYFRTNILPAVKIRENGSKTGGNYTEKGTANEEQVTGNTVKESYEKS